MVTKQVQDYMEANEASYLDAISKAIEEAAGDPMATAKAITAINDERKATAQKAVLEQATTANAVALEQTKAVDAFKANAADKLNPVWKELTAGFKAITSIKSFTYRVERDENGNLGNPVVLLGEPKRTRTASTSGTSGRGEPLTVNGKEYPSAAAAKNDLLPAKASTSMSRPAIISALTTAKHTVA